MRGNAILLGMYGVHNRRNFEFLENVSSSWHEVHNYLHFFSFLLEHLTVPKMFGQLYTVYGVVYDNVSENDC